MKAGTKKLLFTFFMILLFELSCQACPSCVGKSQRGTPAFFEDELYENGGNHETSNAIISRGEFNSSTQQLPTLS